MKRMYMFLAAMGLAAALTACGNAEEKKDTESNTEQQVTEESQSGNDGADETDDSLPSRELPRELSAAELQSFTRWVNQGDVNGFLMSEYGSVKDADLDQVFYAGAGIETEPLSSEEQQEYLRLSGQEEIYTEITRLTTAQINEVLKKRTGLTMEEMTKPLNWYYLEDSDAWVSEHGDTNYMSFTCVSGQETAAGIYDLACVPGDEYYRPLVSSCTLTLELYEGDYRIVSNLYDDSLAYSKEIWRVEDQCFDVDLGGSWGEVTFVSYAPDRSEYGSIDASFALEKNGEIIYEFPDVMENNYRTEDTFWDILAVSFQDYNGDGEKDVIVICEYAPNFTSASGGTLKEARLYQNKGDSFVLDRDRMDWLQVNDYCNSIEQVMEHAMEARADE